MFRNYTSTAYTLDSGWKVNQHASGNSTMCATLLFLLKIPHQQVKLWASLRSLDWVGGSCLCKETFLRLNQTVAPLGESSQVITL